ncbi:MAG: MFS transporter [Chloroflexi bacterium]|nr:MFS transporter [Chloroflexota bacterium]
MAKLERSQGEGAGNTARTPNLIEQRTSAGYAGDQDVPGLGAVDGTGSGVTGLRTFDSFRNRQFRLYWFAMMGQMGAMNMQMMARVWFAYDLTGSATMLGAMALALALPMLVFSLFGGIIADRSQKRYVLLAGQAASGALALGVAVSISIGSITIVHLLVAGVIQGTIMGLMMPSRQAIIPEIVGEKGLMNAVSLNAAGMNINRLLAPAAAGFLIDGIGIEGVYYAMTGLYVIAVGFIIALRPTRSITVHSESAWDDLKEGARYVRGNTIVLGLLFLTLLTVILSVPFQFLLPIFTEDILDVGARGLGVLFSLSGIGALVGSLVIASLGNRNRGRLFILSSAVLAVALIGFSISTWYPLSLLIIIPIGLGNAGRMTLSNTLVQTYTDNAHRGRVMSFYMMEFGLMSIATFGISVLSEFIGIQWAIGGAAGILLAITLYYLAFVPGMRRLQ